MSGFQMGADHQNKFGVRKIRKLAVETIPQRKPGAGSSRTNIGVAVVSIYAPRLQYPVHEAFMSWATDVISDFVVTFFLNSLAYFSGNIIEDNIPGNTLPFSRAPFSNPAHWIQNTVRVFNLVDRCRPFGAKSPSTCRMIGVAFKLAHLTGFFVNIT